MPRKTKQEEISGWLRGTSAYVFKVNLGNYETNLSIIATDAEEAVKLAEQAWPINKPELILSGQIHTIKQL
jgi:hypothetical protein